MKKFLLAFIVVCSLLSSISFAYTEKSIKGSSGETYVTVNPEYFTVEFEDYDMPKVTCVMTGKSYVFKLCKNAYFIENTFRFDKTILDDLSKSIVLDFCKTIIVS